MTPLQVAILVYIALIGLVVGSYLNVLIHRLPRGLSTVLPRSRCPHCQELIRARDNLPVLSYLLLGGRCRHCRKPIAWRYPAVEATTAALFVLSVLRFGLGLEGWVAAGLSAALVALTVIDIEHMILPDVITLPGIGLGLALQPWLGWTSLRAAVVGALLGAGILLAIDGLWYLLRRQHGIGLGDVKMLAMVGAFLGWPGVLVTLFFGTLVGSTVGIGLMATGRVELGSKLPFGAFLAPAALLALFFGATIVRAYLGLL